MKSQSFLILASSSSARRMLLERLSLSFEAVSPDIDETPRLGETPEALVARLTKEKGEAVRKKYPRAIIISSDQVIVVKGEAISKPETREGATQQLLNESGEWVEALCGVGVLNTTTDDYQFACVKTRVLFQKLTLSQIENYLNKDPHAIHCAGSLRVEGLGISLLEKVESDDPTALIGLPLIMLTKMLRKEEVFIV